jgi:hypothetical protein
VFVIDEIHFFVQAEFVDKSSDSCTDPSITITPFRRITISKDH